MLFHKLIDIEINEFLQEAKNDLRQRYGIVVDKECTIVKRVDTFFKEKYLRTVA